MAKPKKSPVVQAERLHQKRMEKLISNAEKEAAREHSITVDLRPAIRESFAQHRRMSETKKAEESS